MAYKQYPKPLSEKSLQKKYAELNFSEEKIDFLKKFIHACTNLYGCISLQDAWDVYKQLSAQTDVPKIKRADLVRISEVLRREVLPYYVYEVDELFELEPRSDLQRQFVSRYLIRNGYGKLTFYYEVQESQCEYGYYVPDNLLSFVEMPVPLQEQSLLAFLGKLKVTEDEYHTRWGKIEKCSDHKGETLDSFSFMNREDRFDYQYENGEIEGHKGNSAAAQRMLDENNSMTEAQKIVRLLKWYGNIGRVAPTDMIQYTVDELNEVGVKITPELMQKLVERISDFHNSSYLMCLCGWRPFEL